jgi:superfamily II DNA or RNA helicase
MTKKILHTHQQCAARFFPKSAFDLYCKYLMSDGSDQYGITLLRNVLKKDPSWAWAWVDMGASYLERQLRAQALKAYQCALQDARTHLPLVYFDAACAALDYDTAVEYYRRCIDLDPDYPGAQTNLAWIFKRHRHYDLAEPCLRYALAHDEGNKQICRDLFACLIKQDKKDDIAALVQQYPEHFQTKRYRERIGKIKRNDEHVDPEALLQYLQKKTENQYAGTITVSQDNSSIQLYEHQKQAISKLDNWKRTTDHGAGLLVLPTGGGKTLTATYWLMKSVLDSGGKVLWVAHRHELLNQAFNAFRRVCYHDLSPHHKDYRYRIVSGQHDKAIHIRPEDDILIASKGSLAHDLSHIQTKWIKPNCGRICMVIDEAHHATAGEYRKLIHAMQEWGGNFRLLGLTATPFRTAEKEQGLLSKLFPDDILYKTDLRTLIQQGILSDPIFHPIQTQIKMADLFRKENADALLEKLVHEKKFDFDSPGAPGEKAARLIAAHSERNRLIVDQYVNHQELYGKTLVFAINVNMAIALNKLFQERGVRSDYVISDVSDAITGANRSNEANQNALKRFRDGELDVLVNVNILTEGTDLPQVQSVFLTRPTKSTILMTQMIGRALRGEKAGGTAKAYIVSFLDDWQAYIAWVNPEKLYIDSNADFTEQTPDRKDYLIRLVSIEKLEEFAKLADDNLDDAIGEQFTFLERIPVGVYQFSYLPDGEDESKSCTILVYDCMQESYRQLMDWMATADLSDLDASAAHVDQTLFGEKDRLLGYRVQDVADILAYYRQTETKPQWIPLEERAQYDVASLAQYIINNHMDDMAVRQYLESEWSRSEGKWTAFFGYQNFKAFRKAVQLERDRLIYGEEPPKVDPITMREEIQIQDLPLEEIRRRFPSLGEKLRTAVFEKYKDTDGFYYSAMSGYRSMNRLDFQIDHIQPMAQGGKTILDNLQLLTRLENRIKGDHWA